MPQPNSVNNHHLHSAHQFGDHSVQEIAQEQSASDVPMQSATPEPKENDDQSEFPLPTTEPIIDQDLEHDSPVH